MAIAQAVGVLAGIGRALYRAIVDREPERFAGQLEAAVIEAAGYEVSREEP